MRKVLLTILISTLSLLVLSAYAQNGFTGRQEIPLKGVDKGLSTGVPRTTVVFFATAFIADQTIVVDFLCPIENVTVLITNLTTGEVIHSEIYNLQDNAIIQLNAEAADYRIDIISESLILEGEFTL